MYRRTIIFVTLLSAYLLLLGHDIIPHHHHDHVSIEMHHDHHDDSRDDDDHEGLPEFFAQFVHAPYQAPGNTTVSLVITYKDYAAESVDLLANPPAPPDINIDPPDPSEDVGFVRDVRISSLALRAPPVS